LYRAKEGGRDRVYFHHHGLVELPDKPPAPKPPGGGGTEAPAAPAPGEEAPVSGDTIQKII
jgi:hypothetical protein